MEPKSSDGENDGKIITLNIDKPPFSPSGFSLGYSGHGEEIGRSFLLTFYFAPPEAQEEESHTHSVISRYSLDWDEGYSLAKSIMNMIDEKMPDAKKKFEAKFEASKKESASKH